MKSIIAWFKSTPSLSSIVSNFDKTKKQLDAFIEQQSVMIDDKKEQLADLHTEIKDHETDVQRARAINKNIAKLLAA